MKNLVATAVLAFAALSTPALAALPAPDFVFKMNSPGCQSETVTKSIVSMMADGDKEAWSKELATRLLSGECVVFTKGDSAYFKDRHLFAGTIQVRKPGDPRSYWVPDFGGTISK